MSYATLDDLITRYGSREILQRTDLVAAGEPSEVVAQRALDSASAMIDARLRQRYLVPLSPVPAQIRDMAEVLARWKLFTFNPPEHIVADAKMVLAELDKIATGLLTLDSAPAASGATTSGLPEFTQGERIFTSDTLSGY
ncbi:MAG: gp436 family protein [Panacagrimonas sp.]